MPRNFTALLALLLGLSGCATIQAENLAEGISQQTTLFSSATHPGDGCYRIPALATAPNGGLLAAADDRVTSCEDLGKNRDINIVLRRSTDRGATWLPATTVVDYPEGKSASDPSLLVDRITGAVFLFYNYMDHDAAPGVYKIHFMKSKDDGETWGPPHDITPEIAKPEWEKDLKFVTSGNGTQTKDGVLLHVLVNVQRGAHVITSKDHGEHWSLNETALNPGDESRIVELPDGAWMVNSRAARKYGMRYTHLSHDNGLTWQSRPEPTLIDPACNAGLIQCAAGPSDTGAPVLLFANAASKRSRAKLTVRFSHDNGATWSAGRVVYPGQAAYSVLTDLGNGEVGLLFEKDDYATIDFVRLSAAWITQAP